MADYNSGLFINPDYATPEQVQQMRLYAEQLLKPKSPSEIAPSWTGALAAGLQGFMGGQRLNQANQLQRQLLQQGQQGIQQAAGANPYAAQLFGAPNPTLPQASNNAGAGAQPRGIRNNNPGNIEDGPFAKSIPGYQGSDGRFAVFDTPEHGQQAMDSLLSSYGKRGLNTPNAVINRWAPAGENNSTAYAATVAKQLGVDPNAPINMADPAVRQQLGQAITGYENGGQRPMPTQMAQNGGDLSAFYMNPSIPQALKDKVREGLAPAGVTDVYGRPGVRMGAMGETRGLPVTGPFQPGVMVPSSVNAGGANVSTSVPLTAPNSGGGPQNLQGQMQPLMDVAKTMGPQGAALGAENEQTKQAVDQAYQTIPIRQTLMTMKDDILSHGDKMVWGPTSDWITNLKRGLAQHAPGFFKKEDLEALASSDSFEKLSAQLQTMVGRAVGPTDASLFQGMKSVPGSHNSKEGALALIDMLDQQARQNGEFMIQNRGKIGTPGFDLLAERNRFFEQNPIINPITKNPIRMDLTGKAGAGETKTIGNKSYQKLNGIWHEVM